MTASLRLSKDVKGLPISVRNLAAKRSMKPPISLRELLAASGTRTTTLRIGVLRADFAAPAPGATANAHWRDAFYEALLNGRNGWSLHDYWYRATLGTIDLSFDVRPWATITDPQMKINADRGAMVNAAKAADSSAPFDHYQRLVAFVHPPPNDAGAAGSPGDVVLDQGGSIPMYQHELGHMLGIRHAFGTPCGGFLDGYVYRDNYCVMGFTGPFSHAIPRPAEAFRMPVLDRSFFRSERRAAAATLFRYFLSSFLPGAIQYADIDVPQEFTLVALSEARYHDPILLRAATNLGDVLVEYRIPTGDDQGIGTNGGVVVHSLRRRTPLANNDEQDPLWFEAVVKAKAGTTASQKGDFGIRVIEVSPDKTRVRVTVNRPPP